MGHLVEALADDATRFANQLVDEVGETEHLVLVEAAAALRVADLLPHRMDPSAQAGEVRESGESSRQLTRPRLPAQRLIVARFGHGALPGGLGVVSGLQLRRQPRLIRALEPGGVEAPLDNVQVGSHLGEARGPLPIARHQRFVPRYGDGVEFANGREVVDRRQGVSDDVEGHRERPP
ncbi:MAG: hypothetical protein O3A02_02605 [bacterium]|nr:hypothetical protein [bacterium]